MKQSNFSLADVLTVLTALAFGFICFLGKNFLTLGNTILSITWAVIIALSLAATAFIAKILKRTSRNFRINFILEIVVLILFTGLTVFTAYFYFPHYFNVSAQKDVIKKEIQTSIMQSESMFAEYDEYVRTREITFKGALEAASKLQNPSELAKYDFKNKNEIPYDAQIVHKMSTLHADLFPNNYSNITNKNGIKEVATAWLAKAKTTTENWKPIGIVNVVNNVEKNSNNWLGQLIVFSQNREKGENYYDFSYQLLFSDVKKYFTKTRKPTPLSIGLSAAAYLLMLLSWFVTKRDSRSIGASGTASYEVIL